MHNKGTTATRATPQALERCQHTLIVLTETVLTQDILVSGVHTCCHGPTQDSMDTSMYVLFRIIS